MDGIRGAILCHGARFNFMMGAQFEGGYEFNAVFFHQSSFPEFSG